LGDKKKILIVEDDADTSEIIGVLLSASYECAAVASRDEALGLLQSGFVPACVLMDLMMPGMSLEEFLQQSKQWNLNIILMTGHYDVSEMAKISGIGRCLQKPIRPEFLPAVQRIVGT
jgi:CheY-like chemotaxis protein